MSVANDRIRHTGLRPFSSSCAHRLSSNWSCRRAVNPSVRAYLVADAADRRVEPPCATSPTGRHTGGLLFGLALVAFGFRATALAAAVVFAALTVAQLCVLRSIPPPTGREILNRRRLAHSHRQPLFPVVRCGDDRLIRAVILGLSGLTVTGIPFLAAFRITVGGFGFRGVRGARGGRPAAHLPRVRCPLGIRTQSGKRDDDTGGRIRAPRSRPDTGRFGFAVADGEQSDPSGAWVIA